MASGDMSHSLFAGVVSAESKRRSESDTHTGSLKVARLEELRARLSLLKGSQSLLVSPGVIQEEAPHAEDQSPRALLDVSSSTSVHSSLLVCFTLSPRLLLFLSCLFFFPHRPRSVNFSL